MPPEPKSLFDTLLPVLSSLLGTIVGGLTTYYATSNIERKKAKEQSLLEDKKWQQQKTDRLQEQKRLAISETLEWLIPLELGIGTIWSLTQGYLNGTVDETTVRKEWPNLLHSLHDPPGRLRFLFPDDAYRKSLAITEAARTLFSELIAFRPGTQQANDTQRERYRALRAEPDRLKKQFDELQEYLVSAYKDTYK